MDKIEKIRAEIERLKVDYLNRSYTFVPVAMEQMLEFMDTLSDEPDKSLEEAAQKVEDYYDVGEEHGYLCCHRGDIKDVFKSGAEWQKNQMMKEAVEHYVIGVIAGSPVGPAIVHYDESLNIGDKVHVIIVKEENK